MTEFVEDKDLSAMVEDMIKTNTSPALNAIRDQALKVAPVMKVKTNNDGEHVQNSGPPAKIIKVNDMWKLFTDAHYILVVDYYFFNHASAICRDAGIFNALCEIDVQVNEGEVKLATKKPDLMVFAATLQVFGAYDDLLLGLREWMNAAKTKAAESFAAKISTGKLEDAPAEEAEPPRVNAGPVPDDKEIPPAPKRGGRKPKTE